MVPFPPLVAVTLGALGAALVVRHFTRQWRREADLEEAQQSPVTESRKDLPKLRRDSDGIYRP